ncbi:junctional cadherin 5-associated protein [Lepisosteus oculatus]|uniref:junctional cadherin 5-associated protein n=1 Tax=Lepisosteus oculatus TaxID=7918 RepID=UPI003714FD58
MYSVEDLLISHGYKLPKTASSSNENRYADCHHEIVENRSGHGTANGYETDTGAYFYSRQAPAKGYFSDNECRESNQRRKAGSGNQGDTQPLGDFLTSNTGPCDGPRGMYSAQPRTQRDVAYWRRRGQDFSVLLDYTDRGEKRGSSFAKPEGTRRAHELPAKEGRNDREWWEESAVLKERSKVQEKWRMAGDRKWQSLGTEEWRPAVGIGRQLSDGDNDKWAQDQRGMKAELGAGHPKAKGKSQSLPRVLSPESLQYVDMPLSSQDVFSSQRMNGKCSDGPYSKYHEEVAGREPWTEKCRAGGHPALLPKPRFSRPLKPPSYEAHQQTRGSSEMIAGDQESRSKDKVSYFCKSAESRQDFLPYEPPGSNTEPPVYIPPPSYKKPQQQKGSQKNINEVSDYKFKREVQQVPERKDAGKCFSRQTGNSWIEYQKDRNVPGRKQMYPGYIDDHLGCIQYIPFDDPRVKHIQGDLCGNSLTDSDKIKNISKRIPKVLEQSSHDSAFSPPEGLFFDMDTSKRSFHEHDSGSNSGLHKESGNSMDQSCVKYEQERSNAIYQNRTARQMPNMDQGFSESVTKVKKFEPGSEADNKRNTKKRLNETIFCLVSVPVHLQPNGDRSDQNNNEKDLSHVESSIDKSIGNLQNQSLLSTSSTDLELQALTGGMMNDKSLKKPQQRKDTDDTKSQQPNRHKELKYSGSWPGDQYRDQETQTSFPEASKGAPQGSPNNQAQIHSSPASESTIEVNLSHGYGYPMKGQMHLNPSSNSAFSRTTSFSNQVKSTALQVPPSGNLDEKTYIAAKKSESKPVASNGKEAFGQFLLKPVSRRPWDAIEELETFNKELQEQIGKRASVDKSIDELDVAYRDILDLNTASANTEHTKSQVCDHKNGTSILEAPRCKPSSWKNMLESRSAATETDFGDVSAFSRLSKKTVSFSKPSKEEVSMLPQNSPSDCRVVNQGNLLSKEFLHRDVSIPSCISSAEAPRFARQMKQDASTHTNPPSYEDICYSLQLSREAMGTNRAPKQDDFKPVESKFASFNAVSQTSVKITGLKKQEGVPLKTEPDRRIKKEHLVPKRSEDKSSSISSQSDRFQGDEGLHCKVTRKSWEGRDMNGGSFVIDDDAESAGWMKQFSLAETQLPTNKKAESEQSEDLSNLFEVKKAEGIPENESIEQRAARILGIDVPTECLCVAEQKGAKQGTEDQVTTGNRSLMKAMFSEEGLERSAGGKILCLKGKHEELSPHSRVLKRQQQENGLANSRRENSSCCTLEKNSVENNLKIFLRSHDMSSEKPLVTNAEENMVQASSCDKKGRVASRMIEALQDKLASSPSRTVMERIIRMKEVDSVSRMRRLSIKSSDSGDEAESEKSAKQPEEVEELFTFTTRQEARNGAVAKREITLSQERHVSLKGSEPQDDEVSPPSDSYDPSRVERV